MMRQPWLCTCIGSILLAAEYLSASEYHGSLGVGRYTSVEAHKDASAGETSNDQDIYLGRGYVNVSEIGAGRHEFSLDLRDRYSSYQVLDETRLRLVPANEPRLAELAYRAPPAAAGTLYWSVGRFAIIEAAVLTNDGAELGYSLSRQTRAGAFVGLRPEQRQGKSLEVGQELPQGGLYTVYHDRGNVSESKHLATSVVGGQERFSFTDLDGTTDTVTVNVVRAYHAAHLQFDKRHFLLLNAYLNISPKAYLRSASLGYKRPIGKDITLHLAAQRTDLVEYPIVRDIRETLEPSAYSQGMLSLEQVLDDRFKFRYRGLYGKRALDGLTRTESGLTFYVSELFAERLSLNLGGAQRSNFRSNDTIFRSGFDLNYEIFEAFAALQLINEVYIEGKTLRPTIIEVGMSLLLGRSLITTLSAELAKDEEVTISSGLVQLSYRFNSKNPTPFRTHAAPVEAL